MEKLMKTSKTVDKVLKFVYWFSIVVGVMAFAGVTCCLIAYAMGLITMTEISAASFGNVDITLKEPVQIAGSYLVAELVIALVVVMVVLSVSCYIIRLLRNVLVPMKAGQPFGGTVSRDIKKLGLTVAIGGIIMDFVQIVGNNVVFMIQNVEELLLSDLVSSVTLQYDINLSTVLLGVLVVMLSHVFHYGEELQQQADETL